MRKTGKVLQHVRLVLQAAKWLDDPNEGWGMKSAKVHLPSGIKEFWSGKEARALAKKMIKTLRLR